MKTEVRTITPVVATEMLKKNLNIRELSQKLLIEILSLYIMTFTVRLDYKSHML